MTYKPGERRRFRGLTLPEFEGVVRTELQVPERMVTKKEIENIFEYVSQGGEGIEYTELLRFLVDEELLKKIHFKLQAATYMFGGRDFENQVRICTNVEGHSTRTRTRLVCLA